MKAKLSLSERVFACEACGLVIDRDLNAAVNLARTAAHDAHAGGLEVHVAAAGAETLTARRGHVSLAHLNEQRPLKREDPRGHSASQDGCVAHTNHDGGR